MAIVLVFLDDRYDGYGARFTYELHLRFIYQFFERFLVDHLDLVNSGYESLLVHTVGSCSFSMATVEIPKDADQQYGCAGVLSATIAQRCDWEAKQRGKRVVDDPKP